MFVFVAITLYVFLLSNDASTQARKYVDKMCVLFAKPMLESGTLGTKCNSAVSCMSEHMYKVFQLIFCFFLGWAGLSSIHHAKL